MNHCYRLVWSHLQNAWVAVAETARARGKSKSTVTGSIAAIAALLLAGSVFAAPPAVDALPTGASVAAGQASINAVGNVMNVNQATQRAIVNWQSFDIGAQATVNFIQPNSSAVALNRVLGNSGSQIFGHLNANGNVFLLNPQGTYFAPGSQVNVGGLLSSTLHMGDADFMNGNYQLSNPGIGLIEAMGNINAVNGVALVGSDVTNNGSIYATSVTLASGNMVVVDLSGDGLIRARVQDPALRASIRNSGNIQAATVAMTAGQTQNTLSHVVNNSGSIKATGLSNQGGVISLIGDMVTQSGTLDATLGSNGGTVNIDANVASMTGAIHADGNTGGTVNIKSGNVLQAAAITADGTAGAGGSIHIAANKLVLTLDTTLSANGNGGAGGQVIVAAGQGVDGRTFSSAKINATGSTGGNITLTGMELVLRDTHLDASGDSAGGTVLVGGGRQGGNPNIPNSNNVAVNFATTIRADAKKSGDGGNVVVWSDNNTQFGGNISAKGGAIAGNGGQIEVSGKQSVAFSGFANAAAPHGVSGSLLLDPKNIVIGSVGGGASVVDLVDPLINAGDLFGARLPIGDFGVPATKLLANGNIVVTEYTDDFGGVDAGAVYLFSGATGGLISSLNGSSAGDNVGLTVIKELQNSHFLVASSKWDNAGIVDAGAVSFVNGTTGLSGAITASNSLVGTSTGDNVGSNGLSGDPYIHVLANGNYVVGSTNWTFGSTGIKAGAVTWGNGAIGTVGAVSAANSLVGTNVNDQVGLNGITELSNSNYVVNSAQWFSTQGAGATQAGAATWINGANGFDTLGTLGGTISKFNSLVGRFNSDQVGSGGVTALNNGHYVVSSPLIDQAAANIGAVTWGNGATGAVVGFANAANSIVGFSAEDQIGSGSVTALKNGNYVVNSPVFDNGAAINAGAVTWVNGSNGLNSLSTLGAVNASNSLVGTKLNDQVGSNGIAELTNGNYVVKSPFWNNGTITQAGAATWGNGTSGTVGAVSAANSLVGSMANDQVSSAGVTALSNGNYVVNSPFWDSLLGGIILTADVGAVTWGNGVTGTVGTVAGSNSLVGFIASDQVGIGGVTALKNGNYVVQSVLVDDFLPAKVDVGAVTWVNGARAFSAIVSSGNSLFGSTSGDLVGNSPLTVLANGNDFVLNTPTWDSGLVVDAGAVTWVNGTSGQTKAGVVGGLLTNSNSLIGSSLNDQIGSGGTQALKNGNYVVVSSAWNNTTSAPNAGAVTFGNGAVGTVGTVSASNSLVGSTTGDNIGNGGVTELANNNYVVASSNWNNGAATNAGAVTWGSSTLGVSGKVSVLNSLVGSSANDFVGLGGITALSNGNYVVTSSLWNNAAATQAGAVTWANGLTGSAGTVSASNSLLGQTTNDQLGASGVSAYSGDSVLVQSALYDNGAVDTGRIQLYNGTAANFTGPYTFASAPASNATISAAQITAITNTGTAVVLQANNDITVNSAIISNNPSVNGGDITLQAGRSILFNAGVTTNNGNLTAIAGDPNAIAANREPGVATITLGAGATLDVGTGTATLVATGGNFINNNTSPSPAIVGKWLVYSSSPLTDTRGNLVYDFKQYNANFGSAVLGTGNGFIYTLAPVLNVGINGVGGSISKVYDGNTNATLTTANYNFVGDIDGDTITLNTPTIGTYSDKNVGTTKLITATGLSIASATNSVNVGSNAIVYGYQLASTNTAGAVGEITKANASVTANSSNVTYNGANQSVTGFSATGLVGGETASVLTGVSTTGGSGQNAGSYSHIASGTDTNYNLVLTNGALNIGKANASVSANTSNVTYNGANQSVTGFSATGLVGGETASVLTGVSTTGGSGQNAGSYSHIASGVDTNYNLAFTNGALNIGKANLTLTATAISKLFDGTTSYITQPADLAALTSSLFSGDSVTAATMSFDTPAVGINKNVALTALTINDGNNGANYSAAFASGAGGTITAVTRGGTGGGGATGGGQLDQNLANAIGSVGNNTLSDDVSICNSTLSASCIPPSQEVTFIVSANADNAVAPAAANKGKELTCR